MSFFKNRTNLLISALILVTFFSGIIKNASNVPNGYQVYQREVSRISEQANSIARRINSLVGSESYAESSEEWKNLDDQVEDLEEKVEGYSNNQYWGSIYPSFITYISSLGNVIDYTEPLILKGKLSDTDEAAFNALKASISESNTDLSTLESNLKDEKVSLTPITEPNLPNQIVVAQNKRAEAERASAELAAQKAEQERIAAEQAEQARIAAEQAEQQRIAAEQAEAERVAAEEAEREEALAAESDTSDTESSNMIDGTFILNTNTGKLHYANCDDVDKMKESNKQVIEGPIDPDDYNLCKHCF